MDTLKAIEARRAVKHYDPNHKLTKEEVDTLFSAAILAPTAFNIQNWRFINVEDMDQRKRIRAVAWDQAQVTDASLLVVLCADLKAWEKSPEKYWRNAPTEVKNFLVPAIDSYYRDKDQVQRDEAMRSCGIAAQTLMLSATAMGYQSCPMDGFDYEAVGKLINLPEDHVVAMFVVIGKGIKDPWPRPGQLELSEVLFKDSFPTAGE